MPAQALRLVLLSIVLAVPAASVAEPADPPRVFQAYAQDLAAVKRALPSDARLQAAYAGLVRAARQALAVEPPSVVRKSGTPSSGDRQDYMSLSVYWWPDPDRPDGLPYVRRDGETNPATRDDTWDKAALQQLIDAFPVLALAYHYTGDEAYAEHAARLLRTWFLDEDTRMNPHLRYAQAVPGREEGRQFGIIESRRFVQLLEGVGLLAPSPAWSEADERGLQAWFSEFLDWLLESEFGQGEAAHYNNHASWYDVQVATYALYVGREDVARRVVAESAARRIATQVEPDGSQPHELARTRAFDYSLLNLRALMHLARLGEHVGADLWSFETADGRSIRRALEWLLPFVAAPEEFAYAQIVPRDTYQLYELLRRGARHYGDPELERLADRIPDPDPRAPYLDLLFPPEEVAGLGSARWVPEVLTDPSVHLPDFSYAGYRWGEEPLPRLEATLSVADFGVDPADGGDHTEGVRRALAAAADVDGPVVLRFPAGRYTLSGALFVERGGLVLQGEGSGPDGTVLSFTKPLSELPREPVIEALDAYLRANDKREQGEWFSPFSWTGGLIWTRLPDGPRFETRTRILGGSRGGHVVEVADAAGLRQGQTVRVNWYNRQGPSSPLLRHVYELNEVEGERLWEDPDFPLITQDVTVLAVDGNRLTVKEPLLHDLQAEWEPALSVGTYLENVGIEHLRIEMPDVPYGGHHAEAGYNALYLTDLLHSWVRDVHVHNADAAVLSDASSFVTLHGLTVTGRPNHYSVHLGSVQHVLVADFRSEPESFHPISFNTGARASVFTGGTVHYPMLDQHRGLNHQNLFDDIVALEERPQSELLRHGGAGYWGPVHGAFNTFWNVRAVFTHPDLLAAPVRTRPVRGGGAARVIGLTGTTPLDLRYEPEPYTEGLNRPGIAVPSLYRYQLARRLTGEGTAQAAP